MLEFFSLFFEILGGKPAILLSRYDALQMEERPSLAAETQLIDDGSGTLTIWRIKEQEMVEIPKERHGVFFSADCYIVLYNYNNLNDQKQLLYCWLVGVKTINFSNIYGCGGFWVKMVVTQIDI